MHLLITDSGLGGLSVCAALEQAWRTHGVSPLRVTYVNAWPEEGRGYNDFPDVTSRAAAFDRALGAIDALEPDLVLVACNTLSILYDATERSRNTGRAPVHGIVAAGVGLFERALRADDTASIVLVGTRTTIESGAHRDALVQRGIAPERVTSASCHGLATAIENGLGDASTAALIQTCAERAAATVIGRGPVLLGLCCTHYGMAARQLVDALAARGVSAVTALDPNLALVDELMVALPEGGEAAWSAGGFAPTISVVSKVTLSQAKRENVAAILQAVSPATSEALRNYTHVPELF